MEVVSGIAAVVQVVEISLVLSQKIATFILDVKDVVEVRSQLFDQVETLYDTICAVRNLLNRWKEKLNTQTLNEVEIEVLAQTKKTLEKTKLTVTWLEAKLEKLGGGSDHPGFWAKGWLQMKVQVRSSAIEQIERQIGISISSLQLMLHCMNPFMHEETQTAVRTGFEITNATLIDIQEMMGKLIALVRQPLPNTSPNAEIMRLDEANEVFSTDENIAVNLDDIDGQAADMASGCIDVAQSVCGRISRSGSTLPTIGSQPLFHSDGLELHTSGFSDYSLQTQDDENGGAPLYEFGINPLNSGNRTTAVLASRPSEQAPRRHGTDYWCTIEPFDVLTDHIDNNHRMALAAIEDGKFDGAENHIRGAIKTAEQRETTYEFPFEDRPLFSEIKAFVLAKRGKFREAQMEYEALIGMAREGPSSAEDKGRLCFALAQMHRDEYCQHHIGEKVDNLFQAWKGNGISAYKSALDTPGRSDANAPWEAHPSLNQTAELLYEMYIHWGKPAEAKTYKQRHLSVTKGPPPPVLAIQPSQVPGVVPPTPPTSEGPFPGELSPVNDGSIFSDCSGPPLRHTLSARSVIHIQIEKGDVETTQYFLNLKENIDMEQRNERGLTPLLLAVSKRHTNIVRLLLEHERKPDVRAKDKKGWTVLHYALCGREGEDMVELLVECGADVNAVTGDGTMMSPLHLAVLNNKEKATKNLLKNNVKTEAKDKAGRTAMVLAVQKKRDVMVELLINGGAVFDRSAFAPPSAEVKKFFKELERRGIIERDATREIARRESVDSRRSTSFFGFGGMFS